MKVKFILKSVLPDLLIYATVATLVIWATPFSVTWQSRASRPQSRMIGNVGVLRANSMMEIHGSVDRVIDGDTIVAHLRVLPGIELHGIHVRMEGINAPEMSTSGGLISKNFLSSILKSGDEISIKTKSLDKYGRVLGYVFTDRGENVSNMMLAAGYAKRYSP